MKSRTQRDRMDQQLDVLIDDLSDNLSRYNSPSRSHNSRLVEYWENKERYGGQRTPSRSSHRVNQENNYHSLVKKLYRESRSSHRSDVGTNNHRHLDYLSTKYSRGASRSPSRKSREASQFEEPWYIFEDAHSTRSTSPGKLNVTQRYSGNASPSPIGRPLSILSRSTGYELGELSPHSSRSVSPVMYNSRHSVASSRSVSPARNKSGAIGPFTQMMEAARRREGTGKQEYFRGRDSQTGKPLPGRHGFMNYSWPYGLNHIGDAYENPNRREPSESPRASKMPYVPPPPPPPIYRRAKSVEPPKVVRPPVLSKSEGNTPIPDHMIGLHHIIVEDTHVPTPPRFGTLSYGGRYPNAAMAPYIDGPPCALCHKAITESRCIYGADGQYHVWHFNCSFCSVILRENDFIVAADNKPYCNNCHKRMYP